MITDDEKSAISASLGMNHMRRRRGGYPVISPNGYRLETTETSVISVTEPLLLTDADSGKTYSLDSAIARLFIPLRTTLTTGWNISIQCTVTSTYAASVETGDGVVNFDDDPWDGITMFSLDAKATITFNGMSFDAVAIAGTVKGYLD